MNLFFFGTLMDEEVRAIVCGRAVAVRPALLRGWRRPHVAGRHYPMLVQQPGGRIAGMVAENVDADSVRRLQIYEGWEYELRPFRLETVTGPLAAHVFVCPPGIASAAPEWRLERWQLRHKRAFLPELRRQMVRALSNDGLRSRSAGQRLWPGA